MRLRGWWGKVRPRAPALSRRGVGVIALLAVLSCAVAGIVAGLVHLRWDAGPESFLPAGDATLAALHDAAGSFGGDPIVVLAESSEPRTLLSHDEVPSLLDLEGQLAALPTVAAVYGPATIANQIAISSQNFLAGLSGHRDRVRADAQDQARAEGRSASSAEQEAERAVAEFDLRYGTLLVQGLPAGLPTLHNPGFVSSVIFTEDGTPRTQWRFVVPEATAVAILIRPQQGLAQAETEQLVAQVRSTVADADLRAERVTVSGAPALATALGDQLRREILLLGGLAIVLIGACYLFTPWLRNKRARLVPPLATVCATALVLAAFGWFGHPLPLGVIAFLPILLGIGSDFPAYLMRGGGQRRLVVTAIASAAGFASLAVTPLPFVRDLGIALAVGLLVSLVIGLLCRRYFAAPDDPARSAAPMSSTQPDSVAPLSRRIGLITVLSAVAVLGWVGLPQLDVQAKPDELASGLRAVTDAHYVERKLGASGEVQVSLRGNDVTTPAALDWMRRAQEAAVVGFGDQVRVIVSMPDLVRFLGPSPTSEQLVAGLRHIPSYLTDAVIRADGRHAVLSLGVKLADLDDQRRLVEGLRAALPPPPEGLAADLVGLPVAGARAYEMVSNDRYRTTAIGMVVTGLVLFAGLTRRTDALRAVLAAALATGWGLAGAWGLGIELTPLTLALGALTTVIACEYTVVLADRCGSGGTGMRRTVGVAALTAALGYGVLAVSGISMIRDFGALLACTVGLALAAAHLVVRLLPSQPSDGSRRVSIRRGDNVEVRV